MAYSCSRSAALLLALGACGHVTDDDTTEGVTDDPAAPSSSTDPTPPDAGDASTFRFFTAMSDGTAESSFGRLEDAFLNANGAFGVAPGDYYFSVTYEVCPIGQNQDQFFPQQSFIPCRTFRVGANGTIVAGPPIDIDGEACLHDRGLDAATGSITIGIMPFERNMSACGTYVVYIIPSGAIEHVNNAVATLFFTAPTPPPITCGNGTVDAFEECDDGNADDTDGCSTSCKIVPCDPVH